MDEQDTFQRNISGFTAKPIIKNEYLTDYRHFNTLNSNNSDKNRTKGEQMLTNSSIKSDSDRLTHYKNVDNIKQRKSERVPTAQVKRFSALNASINSSIIKLNPLCGNYFASFSAFVTKFNKFCALHNIPEIQKSDVIHVFLSDTAQTYYNNLPDFVKPDFTQLINALSNRFQTKNLDYNLISIKQKPGEIVMHICLEL